VADRVVRDGAERAVVVCRTGVEEDRAGVDEGFVVVPVFLAGAAVADPDFVDVDFADVVVVLRGADDEDAEEVDVDRCALGRVAVVVVFEAGDERFAELVADVADDDG
jgi:hypothetical protein